MSVESTLPGGLKKSVFGSQWKTEHDENLELIDSHLIDTANPHGVTAAQAGASPTGHGHVAADVGDFDAEVGNHTDVAANTTDRHSHSNQAQLNLITDGDHDVRTDNPHSVTKSQVLTGNLIANADIDASAAIALSKLATDPLARANHTGTQAASTVGLGNVTDDAQLKRAAGDINSFSEKSAPVDADLVLIEDSEDSNNKKKVQAGKLKSNQVNLLTNSGFGVVSDSTLENTGNSFSISSVSGTTVNTSGAHNLAENGKLVKDSAGAVFEAVSITDSDTFEVDRTGFNNSGTANEVTPGYVAADTKAADGHSKTSTLDVHRVQDDPTHISEGFYGLKLTKGAAGAEYYNLNTISDRVFLDKYKGKTVTVGFVVYDTSGGSDNIKAQIYDGVGASETSFAASGSKQWLEVTHTVDENATEITPRILCDGDSADVAYISPVMFVFGSHLSEGNYVAPVGEVIWLETSKTLVNYNNVTVSADVGINLEAESEGVIPKGARGIVYNGYAKCATTGKWITLSHSLSSYGTFNYSQVTNQFFTISGEVHCGSDGNVAIRRNDTFTALQLSIHAVLL